VLGDRIETKLLDVQEDCLRAYYSRDKRGHLLEANLQLEVARHLVRLASALRLFSHHTYGVGRGQNLQSRRHRSGAACPPGVAGRGPRPGSPLQGGVNLLDENLPLDQRDLLRTWGIHCRLIGQEVARLGIGYDNILTGFTSHG